MPVYREAEALPSVLDAWAKMLDAAHIDYELRAYDDGSPDGSLDLLRERAARDARLLVESHSNRGHGPTILRGYREARGRFVFQLDSDDEIPPEPFLELWRRRADLDFAIGVRSYPRRAAVRRLVSALARLSVQHLFGPGLRDPNCPYRLMRRDWLVGAIARIPERAFAPNLLLSGLAIRDDVRRSELPVEARPRRTGSPSLGGAALWRGAWSALLETVALARSEP